MVAGQMAHGRYWAPPRQCGHYARENGYCGHYQLADHPVEPAPEDDPGEA
jgi:hypothetical protein